MPDAAATVAAILIQNLFPRSMPNGGDPGAANPSSRSPASKTEDQKGYELVA